VARYRAHARRASGRPPRGRLILIGALALGAILSFPATAVADVGASVPTATSFLARIDSVPPGLEVKVGEGDKLLWMRASPHLTVLVLGLQGEPYLRFSPGGVQINKHAPTAYLNSYYAVAVPPGLNAHSEPYWKRLTASHTYLWPEDRLHELDLAAWTPGNGGYVGRWNIPLRVNGQPATISGALLYATAPSLAWFLPIVVVLACLPALLRLRRRSLNALTMLLLACLALLAFVVCKFAFDLYGRPEASAEQQIGFGLNLAVAVAALILLLRSPWRAPMAVIVGLLSLAEGLDMRDTLTRGFVLAALPTIVVRCAAIVAIAAGAGAALIPPLGGLLTSDPETNPWTPAPNDERIGVAQTTRP
jgi:hypothetical protein